MLSEEQPQTNKESKKSSEFARYLILMAKGLDKYGLKRVKESIQSLDPQEHNKNIYRNHILNYIIEVVCTEYGVSENDIKSKDQRGINIEARDYVIILAKENLSISDIQLAEELERTRQLVNNIHKGFKSLSREKKIDEPFFTKYDKLNDRVVIYIQNLQNGL